MTTFEIRMATVDDRDVLVGFNRAMARETESKELDAKVLGRGVAKLLGDRSLGFYAVVAVEREIAAGLMVTTEWSDWRNGMFWWIQSVYVRPQFRRQGLYRELYAFVKELAATDGGVCGFRLYVERENAPAQRTYEALGMRETCYRMYEEGSEELTVDDGPLP